MTYSNHSDLQIQIIGGILHLTTLAIDIQPNKHAQAGFTAMIDSGSHFANLEKQLREETVTITDANQGVIFAGYIDRFEIQKENGLYQLTAQALSGTIKLDRQRKSRSFQDIGQSYLAIIKQVLQDTPQSDHISTVGINDLIAHPLIQYEETDWAFLKRLASHFGAMLIPETTEPRARFWFGMRQGKTQEGIFASTDYKVSKDFLAFVARGGQEKGFRESDFFTYQVSSSQNYPIGDKTTFQQKNVTICAKHIALEKGQLVYTYTLGFPKGFGLAHYGNHALQGASIPGKVLKCKDESLKLHLKIDPTQEAEQAFWYDYTPLTGNQLYDLPIVGSLVNLFFSNAQEASGRVIDCIRENGQTCSQTQNENNGYLTTEHGQTIALQSGALSFNGGKNTVALTDKTGLAMTTNQSISLNAGGQITIKGQTTKLTGKNKISLTQQKNNSQFIIENKFDTMGKRAHFATALASPADSPAKDSPNPVGTVYAIMSAIGGIVR